MPLLHSTRWLTLGVFALAVGPASAAIPTLEWGPTDVVDTSVSTVSSSSGVSILYWGGSTWIAYVKDDDIYIAAQSAGVWQSPARISNDPAASRNPRLDRMGATLLAIWEDERTGRAEVWSSIFDSATWSAETCLSPDDAIPSRHPVVGGDVTFGLVAWEEGVVPSRIDGRWWAGNAFAGTVTLASGPADLLEPAVAVASDEPLPDIAHLAWADRRHGQEEIYYRWVGPADAGPQVRVTNLAGPCRNPAISSSRCCGGVLTRVAAVAFENTLAAVPEVWSAVVIHGTTPIDVERISDDDGIASVQPNADNSPWSAGSIPSCAGIGTDSRPRRFVSWTDLVEAGSHRHSLAQAADMTLGTEILGVEELSTLGLALSVVGAGPSLLESRSGVTAAWIELREGAPSLVARSGDYISCHHAQLQGSMPLLLSPGGSPRTSIRYADSCSGAPAGEGSYLVIAFSSALDGALQWDPSATHPVVDGFVDSNGEWNVSFRGGGCSQAGTARLTCAGITHHTWQGAKSPDVDGDCAVRDNDVEYVQSKVGTNDFCADLDESGTVDAADVAIVQATLGDACSFVVDADETVPAANSLLVRAAPNPSTGPVQIALWTPPGVRASLSVFDAGGRLVADLGSHALASGREVLRWEGVDARGGRVPSGMYFAEVRSGGRTARAPILIVR